MVLVALRQVLVRVGVVQVGLRQGRRAPMEQLAASMRGQVVVVAEVMPMVLAERVVRAVRPAAAVVVAEVAHRLAGPEEPEQGAR